MRAGEGGRAIGSTEWKRSETEKKVCAGLEQVGNEVGGAIISAGALFRSVTQYFRLTLFTVAVAYIIPMHSPSSGDVRSNTFKASSISLIPKQMNFLERVLPFDLGFPYNSFVRLA